MIKPILLCLFFSIPLLTQPSPDTSSIERFFLKHGLVKITDSDSSIRVDLKYSTEDNFLRSDVYGDICDCYLRKDAAENLVKAQQLLRQKHPGYSLLLLDCSRPRRVQHAMWEIVKGTGKQRYVANPSGGSIHNYGAAVDLTIVDSAGNELDMGTPFDFFGPRAQPRHEDSLSRIGKLTSLQIKNRHLLREVMNKAGFRGIMSEWWHFESATIGECRKRYRIIE